MVCPLRVRRPQIYTDGQWGLYTKRRYFPLCAGGGNRTHTIFRSRDFKSLLSTSFSTPAPQYSTSIYVRVHAFDSRDRIEGIAPCRAHRDARRLSHAIRFGVL